MKEIEELENGKLVFHSYKALKEYCDDVYNPLDKVVLGEEITALCGYDEVREDIVGLFEDSERTNEQFKGIADWDVSNVTDMNDIFCGAENFNQPLNNWDVSNVTDMHGMFWSAESFNQPIGNWDVSKVKDMSLMFNGAESFNQPLNNWDVSNVKYMGNMFCGAKNFNQPLSLWEIEDYDLLGLLKNHEDKFKNRDKLLSTVDTNTKEKFKQKLDEAFNALNNKKTNTTDCDWIFNDCKEMIIDAVVNKKLSLSTIIKALTSSASGGFARNVIDKKTNEQKQKDLKITVQKLAKWLKVNGIKRKAHSRGN